MIDLSGNLYAIYRVDNSEEDAEVKNVGKYILHN